MVGTFFVFKPLSANFTKWSNTLKKFVSNLPTNCLNVFGHFVGLALKGLIEMKQLIMYLDNFKTKISSNLSDRTICESLKSVVKPVKPVNY